MDDKKRSGVLAVQGSLPKEKGLRTDHRAEEVRSGRVGGRKRKKNSPYLLGGPRVTPSSEDRKRGKGGGGHHTVDREEAIEGRDASSNASGDAEEKRALGNFCLRQREGEKGNSKSHRE